MKLLESTKSKITKDKNVPHLEITEVVLIHCNTINNNYQQNLRVLYIFVPNKSFGQLLEEVVFKNCASLTDCISEMNNKRIDNAKNID